VTFSLQPYDLLPADLAAKYPDILAFKGYNEAAPGETGRFDLGPQGFHAMFSHEGKMVFVDPLRNGKAMPSITSRMPTAGWKKRRTR
jgi:hypothetical protein